MSFHKDKNETKGSEILIQLKIADNARSSSAPQKSVPFPGQVITKKCEDFNEDLDDEEYDLQTKKRSERFGVIYRKLNLSDSFMDNSFDRVEERQDKVYKLSFKKQDILSELKQLSFDDSIDSQRSAVSKRDALSESYKSDMGINFSNRNFIPKTQICRDDNSLSHNNNLNQTTFSTFLENNSLMKYYDCGSSIKSERRHSSHSPIKHNENINNTYLNMNVNMNVLNPPQQNFIMPNINTYIPNNPRINFMYEEDNQYDEYEQYGYPYNNISTYSQRQYMPMNNMYGYNNTMMNNTNNMYMNKNQGYSNQMNYSSRTQKGREDISMNLNFSKQNYFDLDDNELGRYAYSLSKDQAGCRFLQKRIEDNPEIVNTVIFPNIIEYTIELINDTFGNYLIQKILDYIQIDRFYQIMAIIGTNAHGTRVLQKMIDYLNSEELIFSFISIMKPNVLNLMKDVNGNHIIQKFINLIDVNYSKFIYDIINENIIDIATHKHGCCVLQKCIDIAKYPSRDDLLENLFNNSYELVVDQYGNYVIQYLLSLCDVEYNNRLIINFLKDIVYLSKQKYSSNVIEKCFDYCDEDTKLKLIKEVSKGEVINHLLLDMFGNYVVQKCLHVSDIQTQNYMLNQIAPLMEKLKFFNFGLKLYNKLIITYPQLSSFMFSFNKIQPNSKPTKSNNLPNNKQKPKNIQMMNPQMNMINTMPINMMNYYPPNMMQNPMMSMFNIIPIKNMVPNNIYYNFGQNEQYTDMNGNNYMGYNKFYNS